MQSDQEALSGSKDIVTVIAVSAMLVSALTPIILRILNMITLPDQAQTWIIEESETRHPDGSTTIHRKRVHSKSEQHPYQADQSKAADPTPPQTAPKTGE